MKLGENSTDFSRMFYSKLELGHFCSGVTGCNELFHYCRNIPLIPSSFSQKMAGAVLKRFQFKLARENAGGVESCVVILRV